MELTVAGAVVAIAVAFVGGGGFTKLVEIIGDKRRGATEKRRAEIDAMATQLAAAFIARDAAYAERDRALEDRRGALAREDRSARRERMALEHAHELRSQLLQAGVPSSVLPVFDLGD